MSLIDWDGAVNGVATNDAERTALFLEIFNRVVSGFEIMSDTLGFFDIRSTTGDRVSEQFILTGDYDEDDIVYRTNPLDGNDYPSAVLNRAKKTITLDANETTFSHIQKITDKALTHYSIMDKVVDKAKKQFARSQDFKNWARLGAASTAAHPVTGKTGGRKITAATFGTDLAATMGVFDEIINGYENAGVPVEECMTWVTPTVHNWLKTVGREYFVGVEYSDGSKDLQKRVQVLEYNGLKIMKSPNFNAFIGVNRTDVSGNTRYAFDATNTVLLGGHSETIGQLVAIDAVIAYMDRTAENGTERMTIIKQDAVDWVDPTCAVQVATV